MAEVNKFELFVIGIITAILCYLEFVFSPLAPFLISIFVVFLVCYAWFKEGLENKKSVGVY